MHSVILKIRLWYRQNDALLYGIQLFSVCNKLLIEVGINFSEYTCKDFYLNEDERIIGFKARKYSEKEAWLYDF